MNLKTLEIPTVGGFQLTNAGPDVEYMFVPGKEIEIYNSTEEAISLIRHYLDNEHQRKLIAEAGALRVLKDHTLEKRVRQMLDLMAK